MAGRDGKKQARSANVGRRLLVGMGAGAGVFFAAAAMATGSAAPAKADFEELLDPIIQPILTSLTDSLAAFDPAAALDLTSWTDSFLASLNSIDLAVPSIAEPAAAAASSTSDVAALTGGTIPLTVLEDTEPAVNASIDGGSSVPLLVDTGSDGLVIPWQDLGSSSSQAFENLLSLGTPTGISESGYSGGVDYLYLTYNSVPVDYLGGTGLETDGPVDIEVYSWDPSNFLSYFTNDAFQNFLTSNDVNGILGIGENASGPTTSPFENYGGVLVDIPHDQLVIGGDNPLTGGTLLNGAPNVTGLTETVTTAGGTPIGSTTVTNDLDSGGVYGTIPSSIVGSGLTTGDKITVYDGSTPLYTYTVGTDSLNQTTAPTAISGTSIDSGVVPFLNHEAYIDYANDTLYWGPLVATD
jgi:hypothetical protein